MSLTGKLYPLEEKIESLVDEAPSIPYEFKEKIVKFFPIIVIILVASELPYFGDIANTFVLRFLYGVTGNVYTTGLNLSSIIYLIAIILEFISIPGLFRMSRKSWHLLYYSALVRILSAALSLNFFTVFSVLLLSIIEFYILFNIKSDYGS